MIKTVLLMICIMFNSCLIAKDLPLACSESELSWLKEKINNKSRYFLLTEDDEWGFFFGDTTSVVVDKEHQLIQFLMIETYTNTAFKNAPASVKKNVIYGYSKRLRLISFGKNNAINLSSTLYDCSGKVIESNDNRKTIDIEKDSIMERIANTLKQRYKHYF